MAALERTMSRSLLRPMSERWESIMGSISSEVAKKTASMVPTVIEPVEKRVAAAPEIPHWGTMPRIPPRAGPALRE